MIRGAVLQVISSTDRRGAEVFALELERELIELSNDVRTVALAQGAVGGLDVPVLGRRSLGLSTLRALRHAARETSVVVAHGSTTLPACALGLAGTGIPFVYRNIGDPSYWADSWARRTRVRAMLRRAVGVVAVAAPAAAMLEQRFGMKPERVTVIPTGASAARFAPPDAAARRRARAAFELPDSAAVAVLVGALSPEKNVALAIDATAAAGDVHLLVVGDGPERAALEAHATAAAPGRVHLLGSLADPTPAYAAADVVLLSSRTEALPAVLIEAGLQGLPVVCTDVGFVREVVDDGVTGLLVPPDDPIAMAAALERACRDARTLGAAGRDHCLARFELGVVAARWESALREWEHPAPDH